MAFSHLRLTGGISFTWWANGTFWLGFIVAVVLVGCSNDKLVPLGTPKTASTTTQSLPNQQINSATFLAVPILVFADPNVASTELAAWSNTPTQPASTGAGSKAEFQSGFAAVYH